MMFIGDSNVRICYLFMINIWEMIFYRRSAKPIIICPITGPSARAPQCYPPHHGLALAVPRFRTQTVHHTNCPPSIRPTRAHSCRRGWSTTNKCCASMPTSRSLCTKSTRRRTKCDRSKSSSIWRTVPFK